MTQTSRPNIARRGNSLLNRLLAAILAAAVPACTTGIRPGGGEGGERAPWGSTGGGETATLAIPANAIVPTDAPIQLPVSTAVTASGQAVATIPLRVPDGPSGMAPTLAITVSGGSGNGRLGAGAEIAAASAITRCHRTTATDGYADGVDFDETDVFCLDGARLIELGSQSDGGRVFHTEYESLTKVVAYGPTGSPVSFLAHHPDGRVSTYEPHMATRLQSGGADQPPVPGDSVAAVYRVTTQIDAIGNKIAWTYEPEDGSQPGELAYRVKRIDYSFENAELPRRSVVFHYENRRDKVVSHRNGLRSRLTSRLSSIEMRAPNPTVTTMVWEYRFGYGESPDTGRSLLESVQMCAADGVCSWKKGFAWTQSLANLPNVATVDHVVSSAVEFTEQGLSQDQATYDESAGAFDKCVTENGWGYCYSIPHLPLFFRPSDVGLTVFDADGDGKDDILYRTLDTHHRVVVDDDPYDGELQFGSPGRGVIKLRRSSGAAIASNVISLSLALEPGSPSGQWELARTVDLDGVSAITGTGNTELKFHLRKSRVADLDFDGDLELLAARTRVEATDEPWDFHPSNYNYGTWSYGFTTFDLSAGVPAASAQIDDPVLSQLPVLYGDYGSEIPTVPTPPFQRLIADLDGDGRADVTDVVKEVEGSAPLMNEAWLGGPNSPARPYQSVLASGAWTFFSSDWTCGNGDARVMDLDGNGRNDLVVANEKNQVYEEMEFGAADSNEDSAAAPTGVWNGDCTSDNPDLVFADLNGDGLDDVLYPPRSYNENVEPLVRWNLGDVSTSMSPKQDFAGFSELQPFLVANDDPNGTLTAALYQREPRTKKLHQPVGWDRGTRVADVNGDGREDLVTFRVVATGCQDPDAYALCASRDTVVTAYLSMGDRFEAVPLGTWADSGVNLASGFTTAALGDVTGDGAIDLVHVQGGKLHVTELPWRQQADLLREVYDEPGDTLATFTYTRAWWGDGAVAPAQEDCGYPMACSRKGATVVRDHTQSMGRTPDGAAMWRTQRHTFGDLRSDLTGRGSLGFSLHRVWDRERGAETVTEIDHLTRTGTFYTPTTQRTTRIVPVAPLPTASELASASWTPGLPVAVPVPVRVEETVTYYAYRQCSDALLSMGVWAGCPDVATDATEPRILLPTTQATQTKVYDTIGLIEDGTSTPHFVWNVNAPVLVSSTTSGHDAFGNATSTVSTVLGGDTTVTNVDYLNRQGPTLWQPSLATRTEVSSIPAGSPLGAPAPVRITEVAYDPALPLPTTITRKARPAVICLPDPSACDELASTTTLTRTNGVVTQISAQAVDVATPRVESLTYDDENLYVETVTNAAGEQVSVIRHPAFGVPVVTVDENAVTSYAQYDGFGRLRATQAPGAPTTSTSYAVFVDPVRYGFQITHSASDGSQSVAITDEVGRVIETKLLGFGNNQWIHHQTWYSPLGHVEKVTGPPGQNLQVSQDRLGRTLSTVGDDLATTTYSYPTFFETVITDPALHQRYALRDKHGRVIESGHLVDAVDLDDVPYGAVAFQLGPFGQVEQATVAGLATTTYAYDAFGRLDHVDDPDRGPLDITYNGFDQPTLVVGAEKSLVLGYDDLGRPSWTIGADGPSTFVYGTTPGSRGRLVSATSPDGVISEFEYDPIGRPTVSFQTLIAGGDADTVSRTYDDQGRLSTLTYPVSASGAPLVVRYGYNDHGYLATIHDASECADPAGDACAGDLLYRVSQRTDNHQLARADYATGAIQLQHDHDPVTGRLTDIRVDQAQFWRTYGYDADGLPAWRSDQAGPSPGRFEGFVHDDLHRLTEWTLQPVGGHVPITTTTQYGYDALGNFTKVYVDGVLTDDYAFGAQGKPRALHSLNGALFTYDDEGRRVTGGGRTIDSYTQFDLPRMVIHEDTGDVVQFRYDAFGGRVSKHNDATAATTTYVGNLYERRVTPTGVHDIYTVHGPDGPVAQLTRSPQGLDRNYLVADPLGSLSLVLSVVAGQVHLVESAYYDPFGARIDGPGALASDPDLSTTRGFTGHEHDLDLGLINMRGRIYDPASRQLLTPDPILGRPLFGQNYHPYSYVLNSPLALVDPSGFDGSVLGAHSTPPDNPAFAGNAPEVVVTACKDGSTSPNCNLPMLPSGEVKVLFDSTQGERDAPTTTNAPVATDDSRTEPVWKTSIQGRHLPRGPIPYVDRFHSPNQLYAVMGNAVFSSANFINGMANLVVGGLADAFGWMQSNGMNPDAIPVVGPEIAMYRSAVRTLSALAPAYTYRCGTTFLAATGVMAASGPATVRTVRSGGKGGGDFFNAMRFNPIADRWTDFYRRQADLHNDLVMKNILRMKAGPNGDLIDVADLYKKQSWTPADAMRALADRPWATTLEYMAPEEARASIAKGIDWDGGTWVRK